MENLQDSSMVRACAVSASAESAWQLIKFDLRKEFGDDAYRSYIAGLDLAAEEHGVHVFHAPNGFAQAKWVNEKVRAKLTSMMSQRLAREVSVSVCATRDLSPLVRELVAARAASITGSGHGRGAEGGPETGLTLDREPTSFGAGTFASFRKGNSNERALMMAQMIAAGGQTSALRMVLIWGQPGLGKTHLCEAVANDAAARDPDRRIVMINGHRWVEDFVEAVNKRRDPAAFKAVFKDVSLLIIDDVQRIAGKTKSEEELFDQIAATMERGGQVVLTALTNTGELQGFGDRLSHHLKCAIECEVQLPEQELRREILETRVAFYAASQPGFTIEPAALDLIAKRMLVSGRELDGAVRQLMLEWLLTGEAITPEVADQALRTKLGAGEKRITIEMIKAATAKYYDMTVVELLRQTRAISVAHPRQVAMYLSTKLTTLSLPNIARLFGGYDHTTVLHGRKKITKLLALHEEVLRHGAPLDPKDARYVLLAEQTKRDVEAILRLLRAPH
jgi:chromosomal replication initiator protein